jgi:hypothetical protein
MRPRGPEVRCAERRSRGSARTRPPARSASAPVRDEPRACCPSGRGRPQSLGEAGTSRPVARTPPCRPGRASRAGWLRPPLVARTDTLKNERDRSDASHRAEAQFLHKFAGWRSSAQRVAASVVPDASAPRLRVLTTTGRSTGKVRRRCIRATRRDDVVYVVAIKGTTQWARNALANPSVGLCLLAHGAAASVTPGNCPSRTSEKCSVGRASGVLAEGRVGITLHAMSRRSRYLTGRV